MMCRFPKRSHFFYCHDFTFSVNVPPTIKCGADADFVTGYFMDYVVLKIGRAIGKDDKKGVR